MNISAIRLHTDDTVICLLRDHTAGERPTAEGVDCPALTGDVPLGHKVALRPIASGDTVVKYGAPIGRALCDIDTGAHVHLHNLRGFLDTKAPE